MHENDDRRRSLRLEPLNWESTRYPNDHSSWTQPLPQLKMNEVAFCDDNLDEILLHAITPPDHSKLCLNDTLRQVKFMRRKKRCFKQLLRRVHMSLWTLRFRDEYERPYCVYLYEHAIARIRYAITIALVFVVIKTGYERFKVTNSDDAVRRHAWHLVLHLHAFVAAPCLAIVLLCTLFRRLDRFCELYGAIPFLVLTYILTAQKILVGSKGPNFALFLMFVPVFGITRFRFLTSVSLVALMLVGHVVGLLLFQHAETTADVLFQTFNYLGGIIIGAMSHYRSEILRRRNYVMLLPFCDEPLDERSLYSRFHDPRLKKHTLMSRTTLKFTNNIVEETFYRHWYLIDSCPFDHPNAGELHRNVYRSVRFVVLGVILAQLLLVVQDRQYLFSDVNFPSAAYIVATCLRFTIVIPAYVLSPFIMRFCSTRFYWQWREQAANESRGGLRSPTNSSRSYLHLDASVVSSGSEADASSYTALHSPSGPLQSSADYRIEEGGHRGVDGPFRNNYVRFLQRLSTFIVFCHTLAMGVILLLVDDLGSQRNASVAPCYFLGFLNAILFPHRSAFRVRFVYATIATVAVGMIFVGAGLVVHNTKVLTYTSYMVLTNILGMMISHEEESLRRIFFVRIMLRSSEFQRRHDAILTLEPWLKAWIRHRLRIKRQKSSLDDPTYHPPTLNIPTVMQMAMAGRLGMSVDVGRATIALIVAELS